MKCPIEHHLVSIVYSMGLGRLYSALIPQLSHLTVGNIDSSIINGRPPGFNGSQPVSQVSLMLTVYPSPYGPATCPVRPFISIGVALPVLPRLLAQGLDRACYVFAHFALKLLMLSLVLNYQSRSPGHVFTTHCQGFSTAAYVVPCSSQCRVYSYH